MVRLNQFLKVEGVEKVLRPLLVFLLILPLLFLLLPFQPASQAQAQTSPAEYWAVIVGVADYQNFSPEPAIRSPGANYDLKYAADDAKALAAKLSSAWDQDHVKLLIDSKATRADIEDSILYWLDPQEDADDVVLFSFLGQGTQDTYGHEYLSPYDSTSYSYDYYIQDTELDYWLDQLDSNNVVIILDSCYSGGFIRELSQNGRVILAACDEDESSWEYPSLGHGVFSYYVLEGFDNIEAIDTNGYREVSAEGLFDYVEPKVVDYSKEYSITQHPQLYDGYEGELALLLGDYLTVKSVKSDYTKLYIIILGIVGLAGVVLLLIRGRRSRRTSV